MSREKKSYVDDITKLRRILDNSSDPSLKYLIAKDEVALESIRRRLSGELFMTYPKMNRFSRPSGSMEPRVTIYVKAPISPRLVLPPPQLEPSMALPEFDLVSPTIPEPSTPPQPIRFVQEELFEIEKVDQNIPEFLEVIPKETTPIIVQKTPAMLDASSSSQESILPEWQPVEEEPGAESPTLSEKHPEDDVPEFERVDMPSTSEENVSEAGQTFHKPEEQLVSSAEVSPVELTDVSFQTRSKKEQRAAKKAQKREEREKKRQRKLELKRLKKEQMQTAAQPPKEQPSFTPIQEDVPVGEKVIGGPRQSQMSIEYNNFQGIDCIDKKTAELLYKNGYFSIENLKEATVDDLVQIHGIRRKLAKQIKKEIDLYILTPGSSEFIPIKEHSTKKKEKKQLRDAAEWETPPSKEKKQKPLSSHVCTYKGYTLYSKERKNQDGTRSIIHFFTKTPPEKGHAISLPEGYRIALNKKTGVPYLKKK